MIRITYLVDIEPAVDRTLRICGLVHQQLHDCPADLFTPHACIYDDMYMLNHSLEWVSEYAVRTYITSDSGLTYTDCDQIA